MFSKIFEPKELKSYGETRLSLLQLLSGDYEYKNSPTEFLNYYTEACPVFTATKMIADAGSSIKLVIKDRKKDEFIYSHPFLERLKNPNPFIDGELLLKEVISYYLLTGNSYLNVVQSLNKKDVIELNVFAPNKITIQKNQDDGYAGEYSYKNGNQNLVYTRNEQKKFVDKIGNELIHLRDFNPNFSSDNLVGSSAFLGCQLEISQYVAASVHNNSLLKNQARPSGLLTYKGNDPLMDNQVAKIREMIDNKMSGTSNAGKPAFLNGNFEWKQLSESIKDMDFPTLKKMVAESIYNAVKIPLPMVSPDNMSFANMDAAKYAFYDNAVLPVVVRVLKFFTKNILSKYAGSENLELTFDPCSIDALESRKVDNALTISKSGVLAINEIRGRLGYESIDNGDSVYQPANLLPVGVDKYTIDNRESPASKSDKAEYIRLMSSMKTIDGKRLYTDDVIKKQLEVFYE